MTKRLNNFARTHSRYSFSFDFDRLKLSVQHSQRRSLLPQILYHYQTSSTNWRQTRFNFCGKHIWNAITNTHQTTSFSSAIGVCSKNLRIFCLHSRFSQHQQLSSSAFGVVSPQQNAIQMTLSPTVRFAMISYFGNAGRTIYCFDSCCSWRIKINKFRGGNYCQHFSFVLGFRLCYSSSSHFSVQGK